MPYSSVRKTCGQNCPSTLRAKRQLILRAAMEYFAAKIIKPHGWKTSQWEDNADETSKT